MLRGISLAALSLSGLLGTSCRISASHAPEYREAVRTNAISNKHILSEQPTLERAAPRIVPDSGAVVH